LVQTWAYRSFSVGCIWQSRASSGCNKTLRGAAREREREKTTPARSGETYLCVVVLGGRVGSSRGGRQRRCRRSLSGRSEPKRRALFSVHAQAAYIHGLCDSARTRARRARLWCVCVCVGLTLFLSGACGQVRRPRGVCARGRPRRSNSSRAP
jgi:hypothetical protein